MDCPLFEDGDLADELSVALQAANDDLDSRGTLDAAAACIHWEHGGTTVSINQQANVMSDTAALVWMEALAVCKWLETHHKDQPSQAPLGRTLDLGSGTGALGIWVMRHNLCASMTLSDRPSRIPFIRDNMELNSISPPQATALGLLWGDVDAASILRGRFDTVMASSLIYDPNLHAPLIATLAAMAAPRIILGFARRHEACEESFLGLLASQHYRITLEQRVEEPLRGNEILIYDCTLPGGRVHSLDHDLDSLSALL